MTPLPLRLATGDPGSVYYPFGRAFVALHNPHVPNQQITVLPSGGSVFNVDALQDGSADLAIARTDTAYEAYTRGSRLVPTPHDRLRGIAVLHQSVLHIVVKKESRIQDLSDLQNARLGHGSIGLTPSSSVIFELLRAGGYFAVPLASDVGKNYDTVLRDLAADRIEAALILGSYPLDTLRELTAIDVRLMEIEPDVAARIRAQYPFFKPAAIPAETYPGQVDAVRTIGVENLLLCRADLEDQVVYRVAQAFFEVLPRLAEVHEVAAQIDATLAPASPIPLHRGAARFYREQELLR